jgi:hypothetical protein
MKGNEALAWTCNLFAKANDAGLTDGFSCAFAYQALLGGHRVGRDFSSSFLEGDKACASLELLFWVCFV